MSFWGDVNFDPRSIYPKDKPRDLKSQVLDAYDENKITDGVRARLKDDISKIKSVESKEELFELMSCILTSVSLDLTPSDVDRVLIFVPYLTGYDVYNNKYRGAETSIHEIVSFFSSRQDALKVASGEYFFSETSDEDDDDANSNVNEDGMDDRSASERDKKRSIRVPAMYGLVVPVRISVQIDVVPRHLRFITRVSKHRNNSALQYAIITNLECFKLFAVALDLQFEWEEVSWAAAEDCIAKLYSALKLIHDEAARATIPTLTHVVEDEDAKVALYSVTVGKEHKRQPFRLLPIHHGGGRHRNTLVALAVSENDAEDVRLFKYSWYEDMQITREREILQTIGDVEGVVHMDDEISDISVETIPESDRVRCLLALKTIGFPLCSCESVLEFLEAMYDTLEVLRYLVEEKHILHRDVSWGNILIRPKYGSKKVEPLPKKYRFISDIFNDDGPRVRVALTDFDHAFSYDKHMEEELHGRTGTAMFMANDIIYPIYDYTLVIIPPSIKQVQEAAAGDYEEMYDDPKTKARWDEFYSSLDQIKYVKDYESRKREKHKDERTIKHCAMHDAESVYFICMLFAIRMRRRGTTEEKAHENKVSTFDVLTRKKPGSLCSRAFGPWSNITEDEVDESLSPMLEEMMVYFIVPWHNVEGTGRGESFEFQAHDFLQRMLLKEIRKLRESKDEIVLEKNPLRIQSDYWEDVRCCSHNLVNMLSKTTKDKDTSEESSSNTRSTSSRNPAPSVPVPEVRFTTFAEQKDRFPTYFWDILKWKTRERKWVTAEKSSTYYRCYQGLP